MRFAVRFLAAALLALPSLLPSLLPAQGAAVANNEWEVPWGAEGRPRDPYVAPDGTVFFVGQSGNYIARLDPRSGQFTRFETSISVSYVCCCTSRASLPTRETANARFARRLGVADRP